MSEADKILQDIGYEKIFENIVKIGYEKEGQFFDKEIVFNKIDKNVVVELGTGESAPINIQELKAINKKCEELNWL